MLWADYGGPLVGVLMFRVGRCDETLRTYGSSHLVEHLALWRLRHERLSFNGWVNDSFTGFHASGSPEDVAKFLNATTASLHDLPLDRLAVERRVLVAEAARDGGGDWASRLAGLRYGPGGYGLSDFYEFGVDWLSAQAIEEWASDRFTADNAVLWFSGPPPEGLSLALPPGVRFAAPAPEPIPGIAFPCEFEVYGDGVALSMTGTRTAGLHAGFHILHERAIERLRREIGVSYAPAGCYDPLDGVNVHVSLMADARRPEAPRVRRLLLEELDDLCEAGPTGEEMARDRALLREWIEDPDATLSRIDWHARELLLGQAEDGAQLLVERDAITPASIASALAAARETLLVLAPTVPGAPAGRALPEYTLPEIPLQRGRRYPTTPQWRRFKLDISVELSEIGFTYRQAYTQRSLDDLKHEVSFLFEDCIAVVARVSGAITVVTRHNRSLTVHTERLVNGDELRDIIVRRVGADKIVPLAESEARVLAAVQEQFSVEHAGLLGSEVDKLPMILGEEEEIRLLAVADRGDETGLVAVTSQRFMFMFCGARETDLVEVPRGGAARAQYKGLRRKLVVEYDGTTTTLTSIRPEGRGAELAELIRPAESP